MIKFAIALTLSQTINLHTPVSKELLQGGIEYYRMPSVIYKVAILETGHLRSSMCRTKHNLFGLRSRSGYMTFDTWYDCMAYMADLTHRKWKQYEGSDEYDFIAWWGYKSGVRYGENEKSYVEYLKKMDYPTPSLILPPINEK